jgi:hypothetical protein
MNRIRRIILVVVLLACVGVWLFLVVLARSFEQENYAQVEDGLYMGGLVEEPPPGTRAVLNLCSTEDRYSADTMLHEPVRERAPGPDLDWLKKMVNFVDARRREGDTVFVHCRNGVSRSGFVVTAYLMFEHSWGRDEALAFLRTRRPEARPHRAFMARLLEWEKVVKSDLRGRRE